MNNWRLILSGFNDAYTNMALDEALFRSYCVGHAPPTLRIYGWQPAGISLGYFQNARKELDLEKCRKMDIKYVRRITGGGIIFHDNELTYSLVSSKDILGISGVRDSFKKTSFFIIDFYRRLNLEAEFASTINRTKEDLREFSSFCFTSNEEYDILIEGRKIGGNAQRRRKDCIFQHGSIPLKLDIKRDLSFLKDEPHDIEDKVCSLNSVLNKDLTFFEVEDMLIRSFERAFSAHLKKESLSEEELVLAQSLREQKYSKDYWNIKCSNKIHNYTQERKRCRYLSKDLNG